MKENALIDKSIAFVARIVKLHRYLIKDKKETVISKQIVHSGTSIGPILMKPITARVRQISSLNYILL